MRLQVLLRALAEHLVSYAELGSLAVAEYRDVWLRRLLLAVVVVVAGVAGLTIAWIAGLIALWDTTWRLTYVLITAFVLLAIAAAALYSLKRRTVYGPPVELLKSELLKDRELFEQWKHKP